MAEQLEPRPAGASATEICRAMEIFDTNIAGLIHGGTIMRLVDTAAGIAAARHCRGRAVTAAMDDMSFLAPVHVGDLVTARATVNEAFRTSMEVGVRVEVESVLTGEFHHVSSAHLVFVAIDADGRPMPVPPIVANTPDEIRRQQHAQIRREQRLLRRKALDESHR